MSRETPKMGHFDRNDKEYGNGMSGAPPRYRSDGRADGPSSEFREQLVALLPRLRRFAHALARDHDASGDLLQETCARALTKFDLWEEGTRLDSWLFRMMQNIWLDRIRADRRSGEAVEVEEITELAGEDGRDVMEAKLEFDVVMSALNRLKPDHRVIIALTCIDGMSYREVAEVLVVPMGPVMRRPNRARVELHHFLGTGASGRTPANGGRNRG